MFDPVLLMIDVEASGLHDDSVPTEVAWMDPARDQQATAYLICPSERWLRRKWDFKAERLTGITREELLRNGIPLDDVAIRLKERLDSVDLILSDAPEWDRHWVEELFREARLLVTVPPFGDYAAMLRQRFPDRPIVWQHPPRHRAAADVERLVALFRALSEPSGTG